jgi:hypothetical protein
MDQTLRYKIGAPSSSMIDSRTADPATLTTALDQVEWEVFHPVYCMVCDTEVSVFEPPTEVFHFHNVLASY